MVICGDSIAENRRIAFRIEEAVGRSERQVPHLITAGPEALPHFQQESKNPQGHTFYETPKRKAKRP